MNGASFVKQKISLKTWILNHFDANRHEFMGIKKRVYPYFWGRTSGLCKSLTSRTQQRHRIQPPNRLAA
jgi:hypothetical protein